MRIATRMSSGGGRCLGNPDMLITLLTESAMWGRHGV